MAYFGGVVKKGKSSQHGKNSYRFRDEKPRQHNSRPKYEKVAQVLFEEPPAIGKSVILHPTDSYQEFLVTLPTVEISKAKFELRDSKNRPMIGFRGNLLYFIGINQAFEAKKQFLDRFQMETIVVYGPFNRKNIPGDLVPELVDKTTKKNNVEKVNS